MFPFLIILVIVLKSPSFLTQKPFCFCYLLLPERGSPHSAAKIRIKIESSKLSSTFLQKYTTFSFVSDLETAKVKFTGVYDIKNLARANGGFSSSQN